MANFHLIAALGNERALDGQIHRVRPEDDVRMRIEIQRLDSLLAKNHFTLLAQCRVQRNDVTSVREKQVPGTWRLANSRNVIHRIESRVTSAFVRPFKIDANLRTVVTQRDAFIDILANLWILFRGDITTIARTDVATARQILATVFTSAIAGFRARAGRMTAPFVRLVFTIVLQVANQFFWHAVAVGAGELLVGIAGFGSLGAERHVIFVRAVLAVVVAVANLPTQNAPTVVALEPIATAAFIRAFFRFLVRIVTAIVDAVAAILDINTHVIVAFETFGWTVFSIWKTRWTVRFVGGIQVAVPFSIAAELLRDAMTTLALECSICASETFASDLIRSISTVAVVIATVTARNAFSIRSAAEFRGGTFTVLVAAKFIVFIITVGAIVFKITGPAARNAALVFALEFGRFVAFRALFRQLIRAITAIVFAVAEEPLRNTAVIAPLRTASPSSCAVSLSAYVSRLVGSVTAIVIRIAIP